MNLFSMTREAGCGRGTTSAWMAPAPRQQRAHRPMPQQVQIIDAARDADHPRDDARHLHLRVHPAGVADPMPGPAPATVKRLRIPDAQNEPHLGAGSRLISWPATRPESPPVRSRLGTSIALRDYEMWAYGLSASDQLANNRSIHRCAEIPDCVIGGCGAGAALA